MKITLLLLCSFISSNCIAQDESFYGIVSSTFSTYKMVDLKDFQKDYIKSTGVGLKPVTSFPPYVGFGIEIGKAVNPNLMVGFLLGYNSTGGRVDYQDYSGKIRMDQLLHCFSVGTIIKDKVNNSDKWPLYISLAASWVHTRMGIDSEIIIGDVNEVEGLDLYSNNIGLHPAFILRRDINSLFFLQASAGYEVQFGGKVFLKDNKNGAYLTTSSGDPFQIRWDGLRIGLGLGINLNSVSKEKMVPTKSLWRQ
jgi:hypothetical protein